MSLVIQDNNGISNSALDKKSKVTFKYSQDISLHISIWRIVRRDVPAI
jgi:hypothetical protein